MMYGPALRLVMFPDDAAPTVLVGSAVTDVEVEVESVASAAEGSVELELVPVVDAAEGSMEVELVPPNATEGSLVVHMGTMLPVVGLYEKI